MFLALPDVVLCMILKYLSRSDLFSLRLVCKRALHLVTEELSTRKRSIVIGCCFSEDVVDVLSSVYAYIRNVIYEQNSHDDCEECFLAKYASKNVFPAHNALAVYHLMPNNFYEWTTFSPKDVNILLIRETFRNVTRLYLYMLAVNENDLCSALKSWDSLKLVAVERCYNLQLEWLTALTKNVCVVSAKEHWFCSDEQCVDHLRQLPEQVSRCLPHLENFSFTAFCDINDNCCYNKFDVYEMIKYQRYLSDLRLKINMNVKQEPCLISTSLQRLRLHFDSVGEKSTHFIFDESSGCKSLRNLELKFRFTQPSNDTLHKLSILFSQIQNLTITAHYFEMTQKMFSSISAFGKLNIFVYRKQNFCGSSNTSVNIAERDSLLQYLRTICDAKHVELHLNVKQKIFADNSDIFIDFIYMIVELALRRRDTFYQIYLSSTSFGNFTLPYNMSYKIIRSFMSMISLWNKQKY